MNFGHVDQEYEIVAEVGSRWYELGKMLGPIIPAELGSQSHPTQT